MGEGALSAFLVAKLFFDNVVRSFGIPVGVVSSREPRFTASFWWELLVYLGTKLLMNLVHYL